MMRRGDLDTTQLSNSSKQQLLLFIHLNGIVNDYVDRRRSSNEKAEFCAYSNNTAYINFAFALLYFATW
jgi:hypothetical protein